MKRLVVAAILALGIHGLLLASNPQWLRPPERPAWQPGTVTVTLSYREPTQAEPMGPSQHTLPPPPEEPAPPQVQKKPGPTERGVEKTVEESPPEKPIHRPTPHITPQRTRPMEMPPQREEPAVSKPAAATEQAPETDSAEAVPAAGMEKRGVSTPKQEVPGAEKSEDRGTPASLRGEPVLRESRPLYRENPAPPYPSVARRRGYEGTVLLEVLVDEEGRVADLQVADSSGHAVLDRVAVHSVRRWRFEPATRGDEKVPMWVRVPIRFQLR